MNWHIGQRIVAVVDHPDRFKKGDIFIIEGLRNSVCKCKEVEINIGLRPLYEEIKCRACGDIWPAESFVWFSEKRFAPLDTRPELSETTVNELGEIETKELQAA